MAPGSRHTWERLQPLVVKAITHPESLTEAEIVTLAAMVVVQGSGQPKPPSPPRVPKGRAARA